MTNYSGIKELGIITGTVCNTSTALEFRKTELGFVHSH